MPDFLDNLRSALCKAIRILYLKLTYNDKIKFRQYLLTMTDFGRDIEDFDSGIISYAITGDVHEELCRKAYEENNEIINEYVNIMFPSIVINNNNNEPYQIMLPFLQEHYTKQYVVSLICENYSGSIDDLDEFISINEPFIGLESEFKFKFID